MRQKDPYIPKETRIFKKETYISLYTHVCVNKFIYEDLYMCKRDLYMHKRDLYMQKRDLYMRKIDLHTPKRDVYICINTHLYEERCCFVHRFIQRDLYMCKRDRYMHKRDVYMQRDVYM